MTNENETMSNHPLVSELMLANQAPLAERTYIRRRFIGMLNAVLMVAGIVIATKALMRVDEMRYVAIFGLAPAIASIIIWPGMEALGFHEKQGVTGFTGLDAAIVSHIVGLAITIMIYGVLQTENTMVIVYSLLFLTLAFLVIPAVAIMFNWPETTKEEKTESA